MTKGTAEPRVAWAGVTIDCRDPDRIATFWAALLGMPVLVGGSGREGWRRLGPVVPGGPVVNFQPVPEEKVGKARVHLDLWVDDIDATVLRVEALGGHCAGPPEVVLGRGTIMVVHDPEGHELCVISAQGA